MLEWKISLLATRTCLPSRPPQSAVTAPQTITIPSNRIRKKLILMALCSVARSMSGKIKSCITQVILTLTHMQQLTSLIDTGDAPVNTLYPLLACAIGSISLYPEWPHCLGYGGTCTCLWLRGRAVWCKPVRADDTSKACWIIEESVTELVPMSTLCQVSTIGSNSSLFLYNSLVIGCFFANIVIIVPDAAIFVRLSPGYSSMAHGIREPLRGKHIWSDILLQLHWDAAVL